MVSASSNGSKTRPSWAPPAGSTTCASSPTTPRCSCPFANVDGVGLRRAISDEEVERLFGLLGDGKIDNHQNWKGRFKDNSDKMRSGSIYDVADVLKSLTFLAQVEEPLVPREAHARSRAVPDHLGGLRSDARDRAQQIEGKVEQALERWFLAKARAAQRATTARVKPAPVVAVKAPPVAVVKTTPLAPRSVAAARRTARAS